MVVNQRAWIGSRVSTFLFFSWPFDVVDEPSSTHQSSGTQHLLTSRVPIYMPPGLCKSMRERDSGTSIQVQVDGLVQIKAARRARARYRSAGQQADNVRDFNI